MAKRILFGEAARTKILRGIRMQVEAVGCTMGPDGKTMLIDKGRFNRPVASRDGVMVSRHVLPEDPEEALGAAIIYEAASKTNDHAGDATTCSTILAGALIEEGVKHVVAGRNVNKIRRGMLSGSKVVVSCLADLSKEVNSSEEIAQVGTISSQDKDIGKIISDVMMEIGQDGTITVDISQSSPGMRYEIMKGMQIDNRYMTPMFSTDGRKMEYNAENVAVIVSADPIMKTQQLVPMINCALAANRPNIFIIAPHLDSGPAGSPLTFLLQNKLAKKLNPVFVKAPERGEAQQQILSDIAIYTGAKLFSLETGNPLPEGLSHMEEINGEKVLRKDVDPSWLGRADRIISDTEKTSIVGGKMNEEAFNERVSEIKAMIDSVKNNYQQEFHRERLGNLTSGVGVISVSASTEFESEELRLRVDDALASVRSAVQEGILPGGGVAMLRCIESLIEVEKMVKDDDERIGVQIIRKAMEKPAWQIATVSGEKGDAVVAEILREKKDPNFGFNAADKVYGNMYDMGIIDPKRAIRSALENAVSVAATFLTMHGTMTDIPGSDEVALQPKARR